MWYYSKSFLKIAKQVYKMLTIVDKIKAQQIGTKSYAILSEEVQHGIGL